MFRQRPRWLSRINIEIIERWWYIFNRITGYDTFLETIRLVRAKSALKAKLASGDSFGSVFEISGTRLMELWKTVSFTRLPPLRLPLSPLRPASVLCISASAACTSCCHVDWRLLVQVQKLLPIQVCVSTGSGLQQRWKREFIYNYLGLKGTLKIQNNHEV